MLFYVRYSIITSFAVDSLKQQLLCYVALYAEFNKLKTLLTPYKLNRIYQELEKYERLPNLQQARLLSSEVHDNFTGIIDIDAQGKIFLKAHVEFEQARIVHKTAQQQVVSDFTAR
jgi:hypothetical protein